MKQQEGGHLQASKSPHQKQNGWHLDLGLPCLQNGEINSYGILLLQPEKTKTLVDAVIDSTSWSQRRVGKGREGTLPGKPKPHSTDSEWEASRSAGWQQRPQEIIHLVFLFSVESSSSKWEYYNIIISLYFSNFKRENLGNFFLLKRPEYICGSKSHLCRIKETLTVAFYISQAEECILISNWVKNPTVIGFIFPEKCGK